MARSEEQITLQIGSFSNYVGTHFWNFQDDIRRDLQPQDGEDLPIDYLTERLHCVRSSGRGQPIVTPRALIIDHRGSLGSLNPYPEEIAEITSWSGEKSIVTQQREEKNAFLKMLETEENYYWEEGKMKSNQEEDDEDDDDQSDSENRKEKENEEEVHLRESDIKTWTDFLKVQFRPTAFSELPFWPISQKFDTFQSGVSNDIIPSESREEYFDQFRRLVEECDWLRNVTVISDINSGFGGVTSLLCEEIRDELPRITMPVWGFTDDPTRNNPMTKLQRCNLAIFYSSMVSSEIASVLIPMSTSAVSHLSPFVEMDASLPYHSAAVFASAIEIATGFQRIISHDRQHATTASLDFNLPESHISGDTIRDTNWASEVTNNYQYRIATFEACLPFPIDPITHNSMTYQDQDSFQPLWSTFARNNLTTLNPFMSSLSSAVWGEFADMKSLSQARTHRVNTNVISCRGFQSSVFSSQLQHIALTQNLFHVSSLHQRTYGLPIPNSYPNIFKYVNSNGFLTMSLPSNSSSSSMLSSSLFSTNPSLPSPPPTQQQPQPFHNHQNGHHHRIRCDSIVGLTGLGFDSHLIGSHINTVSSIWKDRSATTSVSLERSGLGRDECSEIEENLSTMYCRYTVDEVGLVDY